MRHAVRLLLLTLLLLAGQPELRASLPKTRVGNFFATTCAPRLENTLQVPEMRLDNPLLYGEAVSGQTLWTKFDPEGLFVWGEVVEAGFVVWDGWSYATAKTPGERTLAGANIALDFAGMAADIPDAGAGAGVAVMTAGKVALKAKEAAKLTSLATHAMQAGEQLGSADHSSGGSDTSPSNDSSSGGSPGGKSAKDVKEPNAKPRDEKGRFKQDPNNPPSENKYTTSDRRRDWKAEAEHPTRNDYTPEDIERMKKGLPPQRFNADKGAAESMERSHEPIPRRDGGTKTVPKWPQEHAESDPDRHPGY